MNTLKKIFFSLAPAMMIIFVVEVCLRLSSLNGYLSPEYRLGSLFDHCVFWRPEPAERNPLGIHHDYKKQFRGISYEKKKPKGVARIICCGGSSTWGWPLEDTAKIYPAQLEKLLQGYYPDKKIEVINAGVGGYSSFQIVQYLKNTLLDYEPDIITFCTGANDNNFNSDIHITLSDKEYWNYLQKKRSKPVQPFEVVAGRLNRFLTNFRFYNGMSEIIYRIRNKPQRRVPLKDFKENINELVALSKSHHYKIFFVTEAHRNPESISEYVMVQKRCAEKYDNVFFVDTQSYLQDDNYFLDEMHPTYEGHEIIAQAIFRALLDTASIETHHKDTPYQSEGQ